MMRPHPIAAWLFVLVLWAWVIAAGVASAQVRISTLPVAAALTGPEMLPAVQNGANVLVTAAQIKTFAAAAGATPGGTNGQLEYNNAAAFGGFTMAGDCTIAVPSITCLKTGGVAFTAAATTATGTSGATLGLLNGALTFGGADTFSTLPSLPLTATDILVGNGSNIAAQVAVSGDATLAGSGALTVTKTAGVAFTAAATTAIGTAGATIPLLSGANTESGADVFSAAGAASTPGLTLTGAPYAGGSTTTNFPQLFLQPSAATASTSWSASGTAFGLNMHAGAIGNLADLQLDGVSEFSVSSAGVVKSAGAVNGITNTSGTAYTLTGTAAQTYTFPATSGTVMTLNTPGTVTGNMTVNNVALILAGSGNLQMNSGKLMIATSPTAPTITGGGATVTTPRGTASDKYTVTGSPSSSAMTLAMPASTTGWICDGVDITAGTRLQETTDSATAPVLTNYTPAGVATNFAAADILLVKCIGY